MRAFEDCSHGQTASRDPAAFFLALGAFVALDLMEDRLAGLAPRINAPHLVIAGFILLAALVMMSRAAQARNRVDADLRRAHERLELTQMAAGAGSWDWDTRSRRFEWSPKMFDLLGLDVQTAAPGFETWTSVLHPDDKEAFEHRMNEALQNHSDLAHEHRILWPDGQTRWISVLGRGSYDAHGQATRMSGICLDVTNRKRAEERVEHLSSFPRMNPNPVLEIDASKAITFCNAGAIGALDRAGGGSDCRAFFPEDLDEILREMSGKIETRHQREVHIGNAIFSETVQVVPAFRAARIYAFDITDQKRAEEALRASEEKYRLLFRNMAEGFALYELLYDEQGRPADWQILEVNDAYTRHTGISRARIVGQRASALFPSAIPEYLPRFAAVVASQTPEEFETYAQTVGRHQRVTTFPAGDHRFANIIEDITSRKQAEEALRASEEKFATVFHFSPVGLLIARASDGVTLDCNQAFTSTLGYPRSEVIDAVARKLDFVASPEALSKLAALMAEHGQVANHELDFRTKEGSIATSLVSLTPIRVREEPCILAVLFDITARKRAEEALRRAEAELALASQEQARLKERQRLARELHDSVSQALYGISLGAHTALTQLDTDRGAVVEALDYVVGLARAGLDEMRAVIFDLRPESLEKEGLVAAITKQAAALRASHGVSIGLDLCNEPPIPLPVKEAVYRTAQEALHNAVKHSGSAQVDVRLTCKPDGLQLDVSDNGRGFDPVAPHPGHLGLDSMRERITEAGGTLEIISAPGSGTHVRAKIRLAPSAAA